MEISCCRAAALAEGGDRRGSVIQKDTGEALHVHGLGEAFKCEGPAEGLPEGLLSYVPARRPSPDQEDFLPRP